jgi:predicted NAD-dependent protein-ADP-ribosyltransferase YbiA (DUF1768 family)
LEAAVRVRLKENLIVVTAESGDEPVGVPEWAGRHAGHVFVLVPQDGETFRLVNLGPQAHACRVPINVTSRAADPAVRLISNFAHTPFALDGRTYASVEAFWQGLKFPDPVRRLEIARLHGDEAKRAGCGAPEAPTFEYGGQTIRIGTCDHWRLMRRACQEKFRQDALAKTALLATGDRPLVHRVRRDSRTIPGVVMADIWMSVRRGLVDRESAATEPGEVERS